MDVMTIRSLTLTTLFVLAPAAAGAQVGHTPRSSPYRDLEHRQELSFFGGQFNARREAAGVAPRSGPMVGAHYEFRMAGPAYLTVNSALVFTDRRVIDPNKLLVERVLGTQGVNMLLTDVGFALNLTGYKSWHGLVPSLGGGVGIASGFDKADVGQYKFGYPFLLTFRPSIKFAPRGRWQGRIDATNFIYRIRYPDTYFTKSTADPTVLEPGAKRNLWTRNVGLTAGLTYSFGR